MRLSGRGRAPGGPPWPILSHGPPGGRALLESAPDKKSRRHRRSTGWPAWGTPSATWPPTATGAPLLSILSSLQSHLRLRKTRTFFSVFRHPPPMKIALLPPPCRGGGVPPRHGARAGENTEAGPGRPTWGVRLSAAPWTWIYGAARCRTPGSGARPSEQASRDFRGCGIPSRRWGGTMGAPFVSQKRPETIWKRPLSPRGMPEFEN